MFDYFYIIVNAEKYIENIDEEELHQNEIIYNSALNDYEKICSSCKRCSCTLYIVLFAIFFIISISISSVFIFLKTYWYNNLLNAILFNVIRLNAIPLNI